jgi:thiol:disulfide interchange protein
MKTLIFLLAGIILSISAEAKTEENNSETESSTGISFYQGTWEEALQKAQKEGKPIFLDVSASWCSVCKKLEAKTFSDIEVGKFYNSNFINVALDGEKGEGIGLAEKYHVKKYPGLIFINPVGDVISQTAGFRNPKQLIDMGKKIID